MSANFRSDNETPVADSIMDAIVAANQGTAWAYAEDQYSDRLNDAFSGLFETDSRVLPVATGTVANSIALASVTPPWGAVLCHRNAHIYNDESGAPEFYGSGLRLVIIDGENGKVQPEGLREAIAGTAGHGVHSYEATVLSLTQVTESGSVYTPAELTELCSIAHEHGLVTHLDGARFGNAVAGLGCAPADIAWRAGFDMLSFGASKNGCMAAEALVFFSHFDVIERAERLRKRGGHLLSKMRYLSVQLLAYIENGLWLELAAHANEKAAEFAAAVQSHAQASLEFPVEANEVFVRWSAAGFHQLQEQDIEFLMVPGNDNLARFVFGHSSNDQDMQCLLAAMATQT